MKSFSRIGYVSVSANKVVAANLRTGSVVETAPMVPYATKRLLVGNFEPFEATVKRAFEEAGLRQWWLPSPLILVHPIHSLEGGLSKVEMRVLEEGCLGAGASSVRVHHGEHPVTLNSFWHAWELAQSTLIGATSSVGAMTA